MGALGPKHVVLQPDGFMPPAPYHMEDNPYTLLDKSDLVLIDAIGTGFSRAADTEQFKKFWGLKGTSKLSASSSASISRATSAGPRRCLFWEKATEPRAPRESPDISPIAASRSTASPCSQVC
jgi:hypothetical protein